jgi:hypothetical protein
MFLLKDKRHVNVKTLIEWHNLTVNLLNKTDIGVHRCAFVNYFMFSLLDRVLVMSFPFLGFSTLFVVSKANDPS